MFRCYEVASSSVPSGCEQQDLAVERTGSQAGGSVAPHARPASPLSSGRAGACEYSSVDSGVRLGPQNW